MSFNSFTECFYFVNSTYEPKDGVYYSQLTSWTFKKADLKLVSSHRLSDHPTKDVTSFIWIINTDMQIDDKIVIFMTRFGTPYEVYTLLQEKGGKLRKYATDTKIHSAPILKFAVRDGVVYSVSNDTSLKYFKLIDIEGVRAWDKFGFVEDGEVE